MCAKSRYDGHFRQRHIRKTPFKASGGDDRDFAHERDKPFQYKRNRTECSECADAILRYCIAKHALLPLPS